MEQYTQFLEWLSIKLNIKILDENYINRGVNGEVYNIGKNRVLKITSSNIDIYSKIINQNIDGICKVYSTGYIKVPERFTNKYSYRKYLNLKKATIRLSSANETGFIIMEKLETKKAKEDIYIYVCGVIDSFLDKFRNYIILDHINRQMNALYTLNENKNNDDFLIDLVEYVTNDYFDKKSEINYSYKLIFELIAILKTVNKYYKWTDIHAGQFGVDNQGNLKAFDFDTERKEEYIKPKNYIMENIKTFEEYKYDTKHSLGHGEEGVVYNMKEDESKVLKVLEYDTIGEQRLNDMIKNLNKITGKQTKYLMKIFSFENDNVNGVLKIECEKLNSNPMIEYAIDDENFFGDFYNKYYQNDKDLENTIDDLLLDYSTDRDEHQFDLNNYDDTIKIEFKKYYHDLSMCLIEIERFDFNLDPNDENVMIDDKGTYKIIDFI